MREKKLYDLWIEVGPYGNRKLSSETLGRINDYFGFDNSK